MTTCQYITANCQQKKQTTYIWW